MMNIRLEDGLPFITVNLTHDDQQLSLHNVLIDTGSAGTVFATDRLLEIGLEMDPQDIVYRIRGIGGTEFVFAKKVDVLAVGKLMVNRFEVEVGGMDYGFPLDGIIGMDFLLQVGAVLDLGQLVVRGPAARGR